MNRYDYLLGDEYNKSSYWIVDKLALEEDFKSFIEKFGNVSIDDLEDEWNDYLFENSMSANECCDLLNDKEFEIEKLKSEIRNLRKELEINNPNEILNDLNVEKNILHC